MFSKTAHIPVIEIIAKGLKAAGMNERYLELGIAKARCFNVVAPYFKHSVAVDIAEKSFRNISEGINSTKFLGDTDGFFKNIKIEGKFDLIFIDANHRIANVGKDFFNSLDVLKEDGIIILHDTYPPAKEYMQHCHGAWKIQQVLQRITTRSVQFINLPFYYGLTLVKFHTIKEWWTS